MVPMRLAIPFLLALPLCAQTTIIAGSAADVYHSPTNVCLWNAAGAASNPPCVTQYVNAAMSPSTLFYGYAGIPFSYSIPAPNGTCDVVLTFVEPNKTAPGQRVFGVSVQGATLPNIDVYAAVGLRKPYVLTVPSVKVDSGAIAINFQPITGNATISIITIQNCTPPAPPTITGVPCKSVQPGYTTLMVQLPDKSCLPIVLADDNGIIPGVPVTALTGELSGNMIPVSLVKLGQ